MFAKKHLSWRYLFSVGLTVLLLFSLSSVGFAQSREGRDAEKKITLEKNKRINGYQIIEDGDGKFKVKILGATNPLNGKKFNGKYDFAYRCKLMAGLIIVSVILAKGYAEKRLRCRFRDDPYLYY